MADKTITQLTNASLPLAGTEVLPIVQSGTTVKIASDNLTVKNIRSNTTNGIMQIVGPATGTTRVMTTPNANFVAARTDAAQSFTGSQNFAGSIVVGSSSASPRAFIDSIGDTTGDINGRFGTSDNANYLRIFQQGSYMELNVAGYASSNGLYVIAGGSGGVRLAAGATSWTSLSDETAKTVIEPITNACEKVGQLRAVIGRYTTDTDDVRRSFCIAQDFARVFPEVVSTTADGKLGLNYSEIIPLLVAAINELKSEIDQLKSK